MNSPHPNNTPVPTKFFPSDSFFELIRECGNKGPNGDKLFSNKELYELTRLVTNPGSINFPPEAEKVSLKSREDLRKLMLEQNPAKSDATDKQSKDDYQAIFEEIHTIYKRHFTTDELDTLGDEFPELLEGIINTPQSKKDGGNQGSIYARFFDED